MKKAHITPPVTGRRVCAVKVPRHDVYRNLNKARTDRTRHVWSIRLTGGKVQGHSETVILLSPQFKVSETTRKRVITEKRRKVCAFIRGTLQRSGTVNGRRVRVSFSPYTSSTFYRCDTGAAVTAADAVIFTSGGAFAVNPR